MNKLFAILFFTALIASGYAQKPPIKFGKVEMEEMMMIECKLDTSAPAVVLCDYGYFNASDYMFRRLTRIKILKHEGFEYADRVIDAEYKSNVRGFTFNLENGEIEKTKLDNSGIFVERETDYETVLRVAMPDVKVGSVIDIEYSHRMLPYRWTFQAFIPVLWSELVIEPSSYIQFQQNYFGSHPLFISEGHRWVAKDVPAVKREPYITSINNCLTKFEFDIYNISIPGYYVKSIAKSWETVSSVLYDRRYFGDALLGSMYLNSEAKAIRNTTSDPLEMMIMAFDTIKNAVKWNGRERLYASTPELSTVYHDKVGNSADINLMLVQLLKKLDLEVYPVVMSTRDHGILSPIYPSLNKLNYVIVLVKIDGKDYLLDATEKYLPYDMLPLRDLNFQGRAVDPYKSFWVDLEVDKKEKETVYYQLSMDKDMNFDGSITYVREDFAAFDFRNKYHSFNSETEYLDDFISDKAGLQIKDFELERLDSLLLPVMDKYEVSIRNRADLIGDEVFIYPFFYEALMENPFKNEEREHPVDFGYPIEKSMICMISLPEGASVAGVPEALHLKLPDNAGSFLYQVSPMNNEIQVVCKFRINAPFLPLEQYPNLRQFYDLIIKKQSEPVVLIVS